MRRRDFRALRGPGGGGPSPGLALGLALCAVLQAALAADSAELAAATEVWTPAAESEAVTLDTVRPPGPPGANATLMSRMQDSRRDRQERRMSSRGWSTWSDWSTCSRTCDGGASYQLRRCKSAAGCRGDAMRYKICNMQPCVDAVDFRAQQCEAWNREARHGRFYRWTPYHDEARACALVCRGEPVPEGVPGRGRQGGRAAAAARRRRARKKRAKHRGRRDHRKEQDSETGGNGQDEVDPEEADDIEEEEVDVDEHDGDEDDEDHVDVGSGPIVEVLAPKAQDGTRCRPGSLDMCINGRCQHVGCDLRIGSRKTVDGCGVCGGDGSTCATPLYHWDTVPSSLCSEACGGGYRSASHVCKNRVTGLEVEDALCDQTRRPEGEVEPCNTHRCPAKWIAEAWEMCSATCGGGWRHRDVYCAEVISGNLTKVSDDMCFGTAKPRHKEPCGSEKCPTWDSGEWSECSASCGMGIQTRPLTCVDSYGSSLDDTACDPLRQPPLTRTCLAPAPCPAPQQTYNSLVPSGSDEDDADDTFDPDADSESEYTDPLMRPYPPPMPAVAERLVGSSGAGSANDRAFVPGPWGPCSASCGEGAQHREVHCRVYLEGTKARARIDDRECPGPKPAERQSCSGPPCVSTTSRRFVVGEWGPCSSTCGEGVQRREVHCRLFLELSRATTTLKAHQCPDPKPPDSRPCTVALCPMANTLEYRQDPPMADTAESPRVGGRKGTFSWRDQGFGECSKSCLGGVQEAIIQCIREDDDKVVTPHLCSQEPKPEQRTRTCNDQPCPPRWNVTEFSQCSDVCGMGIKSREVVCIHEVTNAIVHRVAPSRCPAPPPPDRSYCNVLDCPAAWNASEWSKCSKHCNGGVKTRVVSCTQRMAQNHVVVRPASQCPAEGRPSERRPCNPKPCSPEDNRPHIDANPDAYNYEAKPNQRQAAVKIGGTATIFLGTRLKIRCPVKRFNRSKIAWHKDGKPLHSSKKYHISNKAVLRVNDATVQDAGRYTCHAGHSSADLTVMVKSRPGEFISSEEIAGGQQTQQHPRHRGPGDSGQGLVFPVAGGGDISHEVSPTGTSRYNMKRKTAPPPEKPYYPSSERNNPAYNNNNNNNFYGQSPRTPPTWGRPTGDYHPSGNNVNMGSPYPPPDDGDDDYGNDLESTLDPMASSASPRCAPPFHGLVRYVQAVGAFSFVRQVMAERLSTLPPLLSMLDHRPPDAEAAAAPADSPGGDHAATTEESLVGPGVLLGKGSAAAAELRFEWAITPWSDCSETCGGNGFQLRGAQCTVRRAGNATVTESVDAALCEDAGQPAPTTFQRCGGDDCPRWAAGDWSTCEDSRCFAWNTAMQRRDVDCKLPNGTVIDPALCDEAEKPPVRLECYNDRCKGAWRVGEWSECTARCDSPGVKHRILQCVWFGTKKAAGNACREQPRPVVMKACKGPPCAQGGECRDESQYCTTVRSMNLCRLQRYQTQCCQSCRPRG